tara:strand:+ start:12176 stop:12553 length:378 start_codon:yes stop_codon:yes gene_type:complete
MPLNSNDIILKTLLLSVLVILFSVGIEKLMVQNFKASHFISMENELLVDFPITNCQANWSKESLAQIEKLIKIYGVPDEFTPTSLLWSISGDVPKTILFTEYYFYLQDSLPKKNNACYSNNLVWN